EFIQALPTLQRWEKRADAFAVFTGIYRYKNVPGRHFADRDASNLHALLTRRGPFLDDSEHVRMRLNEEASRAVILRDLNWLLRQGSINPNAMLLFQFSGHGKAVLDPNTGQTLDLLLVPMEIRPEQVDAQNAISLNWLKGQINRLPNKDIVLVIDACFVPGGEGCLRPSKRLLITQNHSKSSPLSTKIGTVKGDSTRASSSAAADSGAPVPLAGIAPLEDGGPGVGGKLAKQVSKIFGGSSGSKASANPATEAPSKPAESTAHHKNMDHQANDIHVASLLMPTPHAWAIASSGTAPPALYPPGRQGAFTYHLIKAMLGEADGATGDALDGWVNLAEAFQYAKEQMKIKALSNQPLLTTPSKVRLTRTGGER
ncbi:MAG: caspase family protein, partial [Magnetococcales bacterium]|nr:caspase family protein [Magnetococcales bacterium]